MDTNKKTAKYNNISNYIRKYQGNSLFISNLTVILLLIIIPISLTSILIYNYYIRITENEISSLNMDSTIRIKDTVDKTVRETNRLAAWLSLNTDVQLFMISTTGSFPVEKQPAVRSLLVSNSIIYEHIESIYLYSEISNLVMSNSGRSNLEDFIDHAWYTEYINKKNAQSLWYEARKLNKGSYAYPDIISLVRPIRSSVQSIGAIIININTQQLARIMESSVKQEFHSDIYIVNNEGVIYYHNDLTQIGQLLADTELIAELPIDREQTHAVTTRHGNRAIVSVVPSQYTDWIYISVLPLDYYNIQIGNVKTFMTIVIIFSFITCFVTSLIISLRTFKPVRDIIAVINDPEQWLKKSKLRGEKHNEVYYIISNILSNFNSGLRMEKELHENLELLKKSQQVALQSQINPHSLINTLETIRFMAIDMTQSENNVAQAITSLSKMLSMSLDDCDHLTTLSNEIMHVMIFIDIQNIRYRDQINFIWRIDHEILQVNIIRLSLQPLIENAIYHGIKPKKQKGTIEIAGYINDDHIVIEVKDNGVGMTTETVNKLNTDLNLNYRFHHQNIGLANVNQRIKLIFGEKYGLQAESVIGNGTSIKMTLPITYPVSDI